MTTENTSPNAAPTANAPSAPPSSPPASGPPAEFRFGSDANVPEWARGKTATEVLNLASTMADALRANQPLPPPPPAAPPAQPPTTPGNPTLDDWIVRPDEASRRVAESVFADKLAPAIQGIQGIAQQFASTQRMLAETKFADDFRRWAPEIDAVMAQVAPEQRTVDNYEKVVKFVRGNHVEEIAVERAKQLLAQGGVGERSGGSGFGGTASPSGVDLTKLPHGVGEIARAKGITEGVVLEFCKATGTPPEKWMEMALNNQVVTSTAPFTFEVNADKLGVRRGFDS